MCLRHRKEAHLSPFSFLKSQISRRKCFFFKTAWWIWFYGATLMAAAAENRLEQSNLLQISRFFAAHLHICRWTCERISHVCRCAQIVFPLCFSQSVLSHVFALLHLRHRRLRQPNLQLQVCASYLNEKVKLISQSECWFSLPLHHLVRDVELWPFIWFYFFFFYHLWHNPSHTAKAALSQC